MDRTGEADPARVIPLLWRAGTDPRPGRKGLTTDAVVEAAVALADAGGLAPLSMRRIADRLGVGAMTLYSHVPGKADLLELMVDAVHGRAWDGDVGPDGTWRAGLERVADHHRRLLHRHPWLLDVDTSRPPLGPGTFAKYERDLQPLLDTGLSDLEIDQVLTLVLEHVRSSVRGVLAQQRAATVTDADWWERSSRALRAVTSPEEFPAATRIGTAAGQEYDAAHDPGRLDTVGLRLVLDGVAALVATRT